MKNLKHTLIEKIRTILLNDWDPLCIGENPLLRDEYDQYIPKIYKLFSEGATVDIILSELKNIEVKEMGIERDQKWEIVVANKLKNLKTETNI